MWVIFFIHWKFCHHEQFMIHHPQPRIGQPQMLSKLYSLQEIGTSNDFLLLFTAEFLQLSVLSISFEPSKALEARVSGM